MLAVTGSVPESSADSGLSAAAGQTAPFKHIQLRQGIFEDLCTGATALLQDTPAWLG